MIGMVNSKMFSQTKELLRRGDLEKMRACYIEYSNDWDAREEGAALESRVRDAQKKSRSAVWTKEVYALRDTRLSAAAVKYFSLKDELDAMVAEADDIVAKERAAYVKACQERAGGIDRSIGELLGREITAQWCADLTCLYRNVCELPDDVKKYCKELVKLKNIYQKRDMIERAVKFDSEVMRLNSVFDVNDRLSRAQKLLREYNGASVEERSFCKKREELDAVIQKCNAELERRRRELQAKAKDIDALFDSFAGVLTNERIALARDFVRAYKRTSLDVLAFCRRATSEAIRNFEARLDQNQKENGLRSKAVLLDEKFSALTPVKRDRKYFSSVDAVISEIRSTSSDVLRFCNAVSEQAIKTLTDQIETEKKYLDVEERIQGLAASKAHTKEWCQSVRSMNAVLRYVEKCRNAELMWELRGEADRIYTEIACEPYLKALEPTSDFKTVQALDRGLKTFKDREELNKGIPSFETKWKQRMELAGKQARQKADEYFEQAKKLYDDQDYARAYALFLDANNNGNTDAAFYIGEHYYFGRGVAEDDDKAMIYFKKGANNGDAYSMSYLADIYRDAGKDTDAFYWRKRAVESGCGYDCFDLAMLYYEGKGTTRSYADARKLLEKVASREVSIHLQDANAYLGKMYENALGVSKNEELALEHYGKAPSIDWAKKAYDALSTKLDEERRDREIMDNLARAKAGDADAQYFVGQCYYMGYRCQQSYYMAIKWFEQAAEQGHGKAMVILGDIYLNGYGVSVDINKAKKYYEDAKRHGEA